MTEVSVTRGTRSVTFEVYEQPGQLHIARDVGHPEARVHRTGRDDPRASAHRAPLESYTVIGQTLGFTAHEEARILAEDIVKPHAGGTNASLDLSDVDGLGIEQVAFVGEAPLQLHYPPGQPDWVSLQLQAAVVDNTIGGDTVGEGGTSATGNGPVTISRGSAGLALVNGLNVKRSVGRPSTKTRHPASEDPYAADRPRASSDVFELSGTWITDAASKQNVLVENLIKPPFGYGTMTLDFNGLYNLGEYTVFPVDPRSARVSWSAGEAGMVHIDTLKLTVVDNEDRE